MVSSISIMLSNKYTLYAVLAVVAAAAGAAPGPVVKPNAAVPAKNYGPRQYNTLDRPAIQFALQLSDATDTKTITKEELRRKAIAQGMPAAAAAKL